jgi:membrane fusion protein (multidrug efflux system)
VLLLVLVVCAGLVWFNFFRDKMIAQFFAHFPVPTVTVSTIDVAPASWTPSIDAIGTVSAAQGVDVAGQVAGVVKSINFKANDKVAAGDVLVQIDDSIERADLAAGQSTLAVSRDALDRAERLFKQNFATSADLQSAQNRLALAQGALERINATLAQKAIKAPFAGVVGIPKVDVGQYVQAGAPLVTLEDLTRMRVDFTVPEQRLPDLKLGQPVSVGPSEGNLDAKGSVTGIDPKIDPQSRLVSLRAFVDNAKDELRPGAFARVRIDLPEEANVIALPQTAVVPSLYGSYVYEVVEAPPAPGQPAAGGPPAAMPSAGAAAKPEASGSAMADGGAPAGGSPAAAGGAPTGNGGPAAGAAASGGAAAGAAADGKAPAGGSPAAGGAPTADGGPAAGAAASGGAAAGAAADGKAPADGAPAASPPPPAQLIARQIFVQTGRRSEDRIEILKGVEPGMRIVTAGQNKLSNGSHVAIDNSVNPANATTADASK